MFRLCLSVFLFSTFSWPSHAHLVPRVTSPQYSYLTTDNQSNLQPTDVILIVSSLHKLFENSFNNQKNSWFSDFDWSNPYLGAGATYQNQQFNIMLWGGFVRARYMTFGGLAATLCHELGHYLGGAPFQKFPGSDPDWSSSEGQADHFAATVCLPKLYEKLNESYPEKIRLNPSDAFTIEHCQTANSVNTCRWVAQSGIDLIEMIQVHFDLEAPIGNASSWSETVVPQTLFTAYPSNQCRMDIFKAGARDPMHPRLACWFRSL